MTTAAAYPQPAAIVDVPATVQHRIEHARRLQETRQRIARTIGTYYVREERGDCFNGSQHTRDRAAASAREWRAIALANGWNPSAIRRIVLADLEHHANA
jgi:hypothetical protein